MISQSVMGSCCCVKPQSASVAEFLPLPCRGPSGRTPGRQSQVELLPCAVSKYTAVQRKCHAGLEVAVWPGTALAEGSTFLKAVT